MPLRYFDKNFLANKKKYLLQSFMAFIVLLFTLLVLDFFASGVVIAAIGSSAVLVFMGPHKHSAKTRYILGGYIVGTITGIVCYVISIHVFKLGTIDIHANSDEIFGAVAVALSMFFMVVFEVEHPPAAAVALGLVLYEWNWLNIIFTFSAVILILGARFLLRDKMIDLI